jgi:hypothetical protein
MSEEGRARRKEPWDMTGPELIEALATEVFSGSTMTTAQAREVQEMITAWQDAAASDHAHAQRQAERAELAVAALAAARAEGEAAGRAALQAELDVLRGVDCNAGGDGPCGVCLRCRHVAGLAEAVQIATGHMEIWRSAYNHTSDGEHRQNQQACAGAIGNVITSLEDRLMAIRARAAGGGQ